jgi:Trypsin
MKLSAQRGLVSFLLLVPCALSCAAPEVSPTLECRSAAIVGGSEHAQYVALASSQQGAIAQLTLEGDGACTAVVVRARTALTARHCVPSAASTVSLRFYSGDGVTRTVSATAELHPSLDLALLTWATEDATLDALRPISVDLNYHSGEGELVQLAGYGFTEDGQLGVLRFATERIVESADASFRVSGGHRAGACYGDSGGPALSRASDGSVRVVGVLSQGASGCADTDQYTRLNGVGDWLAEHGVVPGPAEELADCQFVGQEGRCFEGSVLSCPDGVTTRIDRCKAGTRCGFDAAAGAFGCVPPSDDSCDGVSDLGSCEGDERLRCEGGTIVSAPCGECGATCQVSVRDGRAICTW